MTCTLNIKGKMKFNYGSVMKIYEIFRIQNWDIIIICARLSQKEP